MKLVWPPGSPDAAAPINKVYTQLHRAQFECLGNTVGAVQVECSCHRCLSFMKY
jgi:hypothetical protein